VFRLKVEVRKAACSALGQQSDNNLLQTGKASWALIAILSLDKAADVREAAAKALAYYHGEEITEGLVKALQDTEVVREAARYAMTHRIAEYEEKDFDGFSKLLINPIAEAKILACDQLKEKPDERAKHKLLALLSDSNLNVQKAAIAALGKLKDPEVGDEIASRMRRANGIEFLRLADALADMKDRRAYDLIKPHTDWHEYNDILSQADILRLLGKTGDPRAATTLLKIYNDTKTSASAICAGAVDGLGELYKQGVSIYETKKALTEALTADNSRVREAANHALETARSGIYF